MFLLIIKTLFFFLANAGHSAHTIAATTGFCVSTISRNYYKEHFDSKADGGYLPKHYSMNIHYFNFSIAFGKTQNAVQMSKTSTNVVKKPYVLAQCART